MTPEPHNLEDDPSPDEDLVAYLDGELDAATAGSVETKLASDNAARSKAESYRKTFDLLDYLPKPEPSANFASRTLTKLDAVPPNPPTNSIPVVPQPAAKSGNWLAVVAWTIAAVAAAWLGYFGHLLAKPHLEVRAAPTSQQVRILERLPLTLGIDDLEFLRKLQESDLFHDPESDSEQPRSLVPAESVTSAVLAKLEEIFRKLPAARQQQLRQFDEDFYALDAAQQMKLNGVLERYAVWLERLPEAYRREILSAPAPVERLDAVRRIKVRVWREHLPAAVRARIEATADTEEAERIRTDYRRRETENRGDWQMARQEWNNHKSDAKPFPFDNPELMKEIDEFFATTLKPRLNPGELVRLDDYRKEAATSGYLGWKLYGNALLLASELHPSLPEPKTGKPITRVEDLPSDLLRRLRPPSTEQNR